MIGGGFAGFVVARHMRYHFKVTLIDAKEYFESPAQRGARDAESMRMSNEVL